MLHTISYNTPLKTNGAINYKLSNKKYGIPFTNKEGKKDINVYIDPYKENTNRSLNNKKCDLCSQKLFSKCSIQIICEDIFYFNCFRSYIIKRCILKKSPIICCPNHLELIIVNEIYIEICSIYKHIYPRSFKVEILKDSIQNYEIDHNYARENALNQLEKNKNNFTYKQYLEPIEEIDDIFKFCSENLYKMITKKLELYKYILLIIYSSNDFDTKTFIDLVIKNTSNTSKLNGIKTFLSQCRISYNKNLENILYVKAL
ncbi:12711_t:CDS:1 [Gigaspora margarita]|uniref:12711_t:CDS:1 n=1 Tax=Gigaspora margarita TaxID=4874 RepID=A0ABN7WPH3_GIGMA|nr:12711_t:CDS:1 [Gigaspora margarita]